MYGNKAFVLVYSKVPTSTPLPPTTAPGATHLQTIQTATVRSLELGNIKGL